MWSKMRSITVASSSSRVVVSIADSPPSGRFSARRQRWRPRRGVARAAGESSEPGLHLFREALRPHDLRFEYDPFVDIEGETLQHRAPVGADAGEVRVRSDRLRELERTRQRLTARHDLLHE